MDTWEGWYMLIWLSIHFKLRIFSLMRMSYIESKCYEQKWCVLYFTCIKLVAWHTGMCVCDGMHQMEQKANSDFSMFWRLLKPETLFVDKVLHLHLTKKYFSTSVWLLNTLFSVLSDMQFFYVCFMFYLSMGHLYQWREVSEIA